MSRRVDIKSCGKVIPQHPCDSQHCDPNEEQNAECSAPFLCLERIKNPAFPGENTKCLPGNSMNVNPCVKEPPPHPCDPPPACNKSNKKPQCVEPALCYERIKNPEPKKPSPNPPGCDPTK